MADISQEIDQLRNAVYGEEVRGAFISCMQKIHEENESYNSIKESVDASAAAVKKQVDAIDTKSVEVQKALQDLAASISNGKKQQTALEDATKNGKTQQTATEKATGDSKIQQAATEKATSDSKTQQAALQKVVDSAKQVDSARGKRNRLVYAIVCYADDFSIYGDVSKLKKAMKKATTWAYDKFGLKIKDIWQFYQIASFEEERENHKARNNGSKKRTPGVDMMGYVVRRKYTIIRGRVFRRIRRQVLRAWMDYKTMGFVPWWRACRIAAYKGWVKYSNSLKFRMEYCFDELFKMCSYSASKHGKEVENEKRILLITALSS